MHAGFRKNADRNLIDQHRRPSIEQCLQECGNKWTVAGNFVEGREQISVPRQAVKGQVINELAAKNPLCPIIVEMHVSASRQEVRRHGQLGEDRDTNEKNNRENVMRRLEVKRIEELTRSHDLGSISKWRLP